VTSVTLMAEEGTEQAPANNIWEPLIHDAAAQRSGGVELGEARCVRLAMRVGVRYWWRRPRRSAKGAPL